MKAVQKLFRLAMVSCSALLTLKAVQKLFRLAMVSCSALLTLGLTSPVEAASFYLQHNLVTDNQTNLVSSGFAPADFVDPNLVNPWGVAFSPSGPFWVSNNQTGTSTLYNSSGQPQSLIVSIPAPGGAPQSAPTGQVFNSTSDFALTPGNPARFLFATDQGTIAGWNPAVAPTNALTLVDNSGSDAIYTGLALGNNGAGNLLYAANFHTGAIDVFDPLFQPITLAGAFTDPTLPAGYAPFNIQNLGGNLYVTYAQQDADQEDEVAGPGLGYVNEFDANGVLRRRVASDGPLNAPWGLALAPADFGEFSNALLVGNLGDGRINAFDPANGAFLGQLLDPQGQPIAIEGLWALTFGNGGAGGVRNQLYFTAGINDETHGLFGALAAVPEPGTILLLSVGLPLMRIPWRHRRLDRVRQAPSR